MTTDEAQIRELIAHWHAATKAGNVDAVLELMTDDVVFLVPGRPPMSKREFDTLSRVPPGSAPPRIHGSAEVQEVQVSGDLAFARAKLEISVTPTNASAPVERAGHALSIFRRVGGRWLLSRDANLLTVVRGERA
jgi:uncharacterized protein (TIGR02246 family)